MHLRPLSFVVSVLAALVFSAHLCAQPVLIAQPSGKSAYLGTSSANTTFQVLATGTPTPTYQWQVNNGTGNFSNITDNSTYLGSNTSALTINNTDTSLNGFLYRAVVTSGTSVKTAKVSLSVFNTPTVTPSLTITPTTISANDTSNVTLTLSGVTASSTIRIQRYVDIYGNGTVAPLDPLVETFTVTNGQITAFGGVTDPQIPGDDDGTADGNITTHFSIPAGNELGRGAGNYIIRVSSPQGEFATIDRNLTVTQPAYAQSVSGQVLNSSTPIPNAQIAALSSNGQDTTYIAGAIADNNGNYTLNLPVGTYIIIAVQPGYVLSFSNAPSLSLTANQTLTGENISMTPATTMIMGQVQDATNANLTIRSIQFFVQSSNGSVALITSDNSGDYLAPVTADTWQMDISDSSLPPLGYLRLQNKPTADTTAGNTTLNVSLTPVNALIYGTVQTSGNVPLANIEMDASDANFSVSQNTDANGTYYLGVNGNGTDNWFVQTDSNNPGLVNYIPPASQNYTITANSAQVANFTLISATAYLNGTLTDNGTPQTNITVLANYQSNGSGFIGTQATTDSNGNFSLPVYGGNWTVSLEQNSAAQNNLVGQTLSFNVTDGSNITGITMQALNATGNITGNVVDVTGNTMNFAPLNASIVVGNLTYVSSTSTNSNGTYNLPVFNGTWNVTINEPGFTSQNVTVSGSSTTLNLSQSVYSFSSWQQKMFNSSQLGNMTISGATATPGSDGIPNLVKYAFNLSPFVNQRQALPAASISNGNLTLSFNEIRTDVTYTVEVSTDLVTWTTSGVSTSSNGTTLTATYNLTGHPIVFFRILVALNTPG